MSPLCPPPPVPFHSKPCFHCFSPAIKKRLSLFFWEMNDDSPQCHVSLCAEWIGKRSPQGVQPCGTQRSKSLQDHCLLCFIFLKYSSVPSWAHGESDTARIPYQPHILPLHQHSWPREESPQNVITSCFSVPLKHETKTQWSPGPEFNWIFHSIVPNEWL